MKDFTQNPVTDYLSTIRAHRAIVTHFRQLGDCSATPQLSFIVGLVVQWSESGLGFALNSSLHHDFRVNPRHLHITTIAGYFQRLRPFVPAIARHCNRLRTIVCNGWRLFSLLIRGNNFLISGRGAMPR